MRRLIALATASIATIAALISLRLVQRYRVEGRSMLRAYAPGDRLLVEKLSYRWRSPRVGEVVVVRQAAGSSRLDLKRIAAGPGSVVTVRGEEQYLGDDEVYVLGDNLSESTDSRQLGPVSHKNIVGRVWFKY